jgi:hypothetical protein
VAPEQAVIHAAAADAALARDAIRAAVQAAATVQVSIRAVQVRDVTPAAVFPSAAQVVTRF